MVSPTSASITPLDHAAALPLSPAGAVCLASDRENCLKEIELQKTAPPKETEEMQARFRATSLLVAAKWEEAAERYGSWHGRARDESLNAYRARLRSGPYFRPRVDAAEKYRGWHDAAYTAAKAIAVAVKIWPPQERAWTAAGEEVNGVLQEVERQLIAAEEELTVAQEKTATLRRARDEAQAKVPTDPTKERTSTDSWNAGEALHARIVFDDACYEENAVRNAVAKEHLTRNACRAIRDAIELTAGTARAWPPRTTEALEHCWRTAEQENDKLFSEEDMWIVEAGSWLLSFVSTSIQKAREEKIRRQHITAHFWRDLGVEFGSSLRKESEALQKKLSEIEAAVRSAIPPRR